MRRQPKPEKIERFDIQLRFGPEAVQIDPAHGFVDVLPIRLAIGERFYPTADYADFAYAILPMWLGEFAALLENGRMEMHFMDGPFALKTERHGNSPYASVKLDHELPDLQHFKLPLHALAQALFAAAEELAETLRSAADGDAEKLRGESDWNSLQENYRLARSAWRERRPPQHA